LTDEAVAYHEGVPGHHMQLSVQQQLSGLPKFGCTDWFQCLQRQAGRFTQSSLARRWGFYQDPVSELRTAFLRTLSGGSVGVDTGIHSKGWTREQVVDFFRKSGAVDEPTISVGNRPVHRVACAGASYKLGQLQFRELRERARKELGSKFDIRRFHDEMLNGGTLPLDMLEARTDKWIAQEKLK